MNGRVFRLQRMLPLLAVLLAVHGHATVVWGQQEKVATEVLAAEQTRIAAVARATASAVAVFARGGRGGGSGVVISADGYALTNYHVVKPAGSFMKCSMSDGGLYDAVIVGIDPTGDVALIKLLGRDDFPVATMADSDQTRVGDWCFAVGNPFLLATDFQPTVTYGIVSGVHRYQYPAGTLLEYADCIQTDASINPGNSGGPLFNAIGDLIGINGRGSFEKRGRVNVGVGYAISINQIKHFLGYLKRGRIVDHATLGATVVTGENGEVVVSNILESSDAYRRGLRYGDELVAFGGRTITTVNGFKNVLGIFPRDWRVPVSFRRDGQRFDTLVRLAGVHAHEDLLNKIQRQPARPVPGKPKPDGPKPNGPKPDPKKPGPGPAPMKLTGPPKAEMPAHIKKLYKARRGYANYYFNELNRDRIWTAFQEAAGGSFAEFNGGWVLEGELGGGLAAQIVLSPNEVTGKFPAGEQRVNPQEDLDRQLGPNGSGGLLVALHLWQRMLLVGPQRFGDVHYLGSGPLLQREGQFDILVASHNVVEARFAFDPGNGHLAMIEMFPGNDTDPCEVYFSDYQEFDGRFLPTRMQVRYGDTVFGELHWKRLQLSKAPAKKTPPESES